MTSTLTKGSPAKVILLFTLPLFVGNLFQQLYNAADTLIVGRTVGVDALGAVGSAGAVLNLVLWFSNGISAGCTIILAQRLGARDEKGMRCSIATTALLCGGMALLMTVCVTPFTRTLLIWMRTPEVQLDYAVQYLFVILCGTVVSVAFNVFTNLLRALGDSRTPLWFLMVACGINIVLDLVFILGCGMGVAGAALATVLAQLVASLGCFAVMLIKYPVTHLKKEDWRLSGREIRRHLGLGVPLGFQYSIIGIGILALQIVLNGLGNVAVSAQTAAGKAEVFATLPLNSFGATMATYAAQNYGAHSVSRIRKGVLQCSIMSVAYSVVTGAVSFFFGKELISIFVGNEVPEVVTYGSYYLKVAGMFYFTLALLYILRSTLQGLGKGGLTTVAGIMELVMRVFAAWVLSVPFGYYGACWASPLAWAGAFFALLISYIITMRKLHQQELAWEAVKVSK